MRRRRIGGGRAAIARRKEDESRFTQTGARMAGATLSHVQEQLRVFRANLEEFVLLLGWCIQLYRMLTEMLA